MSTMAVYKIKSSLGKGLGVTQHIPRSFRIVREKAPASYLMSLVEIELMSVAFYDRCLLAYLDKQTFEI